MGAPAAASTAEEVQSLQSCMFILKDLILAATHPSDFRHNEVVQEVFSQLQSYQAKMTGLIEAALTSDPEVPKLAVLRFNHHIVMSNAVPIVLPVGCGETDLAE